MWRILEFSKTVNLIHEFTGQEHPAWVHAAQDKEHYRHLIDLPHLKITMWWDNLVISVRES